MSTDATVLLGTTELTTAGVEAIARGAGARLDPGAARRLERSHAFVRQLARDGTPVYGLTTGCGPLAAYEIPPERRAEFQRNLVRSHACGVGAPHPTALVRAAMAVRIQVLAQGYSGVDPALVELLAAMLERGIHPIVREVGGVGASGDLVELAQMALAVLGEGDVEWRGVEQPAGEALRAAGLAPIAPRHREGLAVMNGTSFHTAAAALLVERARRAIAASLAAASLAFEALSGHTEALAAALHQARPHDGQILAARRMRALLDGSGLVRRDEPAAGRQDAYSLRCAPQIIGAARDTVEAAAAVVGRELNSVTDNPLFLAAEGRVLHGGNFHGQPVAMALDRIKLGLAEVGVASERRLARLLEPALNGGLPPFLVRGDAGLRSGFMGLQYGAAAMAADNAVLAAPASVRSLPTNAGNQDVVSMGMVAARQAARVADNVERMLAIELLCAAQALDLRGPERAGGGTRALHAALRQQAAPLDEDRPLGGDVDAVVRLIDGGAFD